MGAHRLIEGLVELITTQPDMDADFLKILDTSDGREKKVKPNNLKGLIRQIQFGEQDTDVGVTVSAFVPLTTLAVQNFQVKDENSTVLLLVSINCSTQGGNNHGQAQLRVDGNPIGKPFSIMHNSSGQAQVSNGAYFYPVTNLAPGINHTFDIQWRTSGGNQRIRGASQDDESAIIIAIEVTG